jgi:hypothetical protein
MPGESAEVSAAAYRQQSPQAGAAASSKLSEILLDGFRQEWQPRGPAAVLATACRPQRPSAGAAASSKLSEILLDGFIILHPCIEQSKKTEMLLWKELFP